MKKNRVVRFVFLFKFLLLAIEEVACDSIAYGVDCRESNGLRKWESNNSSFCWNKTSVSSREMECIGGFRLSSGILLPLSEIRVCNKFFFVPPLIKRRTK